ncbi:leucine-rich repeat domain-containing protein [Microcoleus sp. POL8_C6]
MSEKQPNEPMSFSSFADWCRHIDSLSESARYTVKVLLKKAGTDNPEAAEQILSRKTELDLIDNQITDISSLDSLTNLTKLYLGKNQITDITFLGWLTNLTTLNLGYNQITDITLLSWLTNLTALDLSYNKITDISFLGSLTNLTTLNLASNRINDFSFLGSLTNLTTLNLASNIIADISFLGSLTNLTTLSLNYNLINDISFLGSLTNLTTLNLASNQITDISFLGSLTTLTTLNLGYNHITDISFLGSLTNLTTLNLGYNHITDISSLGSLTNLTKLDLWHNQITDISFLGSLTNLTTLNLGYNHITDISSLGSLINLTTLNLDSNRITDISFLGSLTTLTTLNLDNNQITDISALRSLTNLTKVDLSGNEIAPLCVLGELAQKRLTLSTTPIDAQKATEAVKVAYAAIGLEEPSVIICSSPRDVYLQIFKLLKHDHSQNGSDEYSNRWGKKLYRKWMSLVGEFASPGVWKYDLDRMTIEPEADSTLSSLMRQLVDEYERSERTMENFFSDLLFDLRFLETPTTLFKEIYLTQWYISSLGINLSQKAQEILRCQKLLFEHCGWIFPFEKICFVCDRPRHLRFDSQNRLHAEAEPAIEFADGWKIYFYHGVRLPEQYGQLHPNQWQSQWLLTEINAEVRRVLIQGIGYARIIQELSAKQKDSWQEYALLQIDNIEAQPICLLKMTCPSTGFIHAVRVPPNLRSAREAIRWVNWDIDPEEFSVQT